MSDRFATSAPLQTAVLFLVFNRPDTTKKVFEAIRQAKPPRLYVAADGPRANREGESERAEQVRNIATAVDWPCEVKTLFRNENLGCMKAVSGGIDWFFENEEYGIILEDDCLPHHDFFLFCENMLIRYRNDKNIGMISGFNPQGSNIQGNEYFKSKNYSIWGWATWQNRWKEYDIRMVKWDIPEVKNRIQKNLKFKIYLYYKLSFELALEGIINTWDYQWAFCQIYQDNYTIKPAVNLIKNIGTHGEHAVGADKNHNTPYGRFKGNYYTPCDKIGASHDESFYKYNLPGVMLILIKYIIFKLGLYKTIKNFMIN
jgi:hypothetical protein